jgi:hypothetical protein
MLIKWKKCSVRREVVYFLLINYKDDFNGMV